ncbi:MAG: hypothetical protein ABEJ78_08420 [Haloferacaceae archaeon]
MIPDWVFAGLIVLNVVCAYWVYSDATERGQPNPVLWSLAVFVGNFIGWIGLLFYLVSREGLTRKRRA